MINTARLDQIVKTHTCFASMKDLLSTDAGYVPTLDCREAQASRPASSMARAITSSSGCKVEGAVTFFASKNPERLPTLPVVDEQAARKLIMGKCYKAGTDTYKVVGFGRPGNPGVLVRRFNKSRGEFNKSNNKAYKRTALDILSGGEVNHAHRT